MRTAVRGVDAREQVLDEEVARTRHRLGFLADLQVAAGGYNESSVG